MNTCLMLFYLVSLRCFYIVYSMNQELRDLLLELLDNSCIVESWGICNICIGVKSVFFFVNGFKYTGKVAIHYRKNGYCIKAGDMTISGVQLADVIRIIDGVVEISDMYMSDIVTWIGIL